MLVLQPTPFCNLDCDYCYLPQRDRRARMSMDTLRLAVQRLLDDGLLGPTLTIVWHAGEPLVLPPAYYEQAFEVVGRTLGSRCRPQHAIQTNATLVDDAWCDLLRRHQVRVGVSVDGPAALHDAHRHFRDGRGSHDRVLLGLERLRAHGLSCHAIAVVTRATLDDPDGFFDFFARQGIRDVGCNFDEAEGVHLRSSLAGHEAAHAAFLARLLERSIASGGRVRFRELGGALQRIAGAWPTTEGSACGDADGGSRPPTDTGAGALANEQVLPLALVTVAWNGDFGTFSPELLGQRAPVFGDFVLGNVVHDGVLEALASEPAQRLAREVAAGVEACRARCAYFGLCGGGAPANKWTENGSLASAETLYCRSMVQRPVEAVLRRLERDRAASAPGGALLAAVGPTHLEGAPA
jgi:uncharacterized protein